MSSPGKMSKNMWILWGFLVFGQLVIAGGLVLESRALTGLYAENSEIPQQHLETSEGALPYVLEPDLDIDLQTTGHRKKSYHVETNSEGLREEEFNDSQENTTRVAVVGDSVTFGWGIEKRYRFTERCERKLRDSGREINLINFGVPGYGMADYQAMIDEKVLGKDPDMVVVAFSWGDIFDADSSMKPAPFSNLEAVSKRIVVEQRDLESSDMAGIMDNISRKEELEQKRLVFMSYWPFSEKDREYLRDWSGERPGTAFLEAPEALRKNSVEDFIFSRQDPHLNRLAHEKLGEKLCKQIKQKL